MVMTIADQMRGAVVMTTAGHMGGAIVGGKPELLEVRKAASVSGLVFFGIRIGQDFLICSRRESRTRYCGALFQGKASVSGRAIHSAVGFSVTLIQTRSLRSSLTMTRQ